ncbi:MAG: hypothetical protein MI974_00535 [Chitinophagales bacterium]|nr:hypothetical protein [Chitinophagales bacterium]
MQVKKVAIFPTALSSANSYQNLFIKGLNDIGIEVFLPSYEYPFPILNAVKQSEKNDCDAIILEWIHTVYTSRSLLYTIVKAFMGELERFVIHRNKKNTIPIIWNLHNLHRHDRLHIGIEKWNFKRISKIIDGIRVFNEYSIQEARSYLSLPKDKKIQAIPQGNYISIYNDIQPKNLRSKWNASQDDLILLVFGGIREGKGILKFLSAFEKVTYPGIKIIIAGGSESDRMTKTLHDISKRDDRIITEIRYIEDSEVPSYFYSSDYTVLPYEYILNSGTATLSFGFGVPIIVNSIPTLVNVYDSPFTLQGNLHETDQLEEVIHNASINKKDMLKMRKDTLEFAEQYTWERVAKDIGNFIEHLHQ